MIRHFWIIHSNTFAMHLLLMVGNVTYNTVSILK